MAADKKPAVTAKAVAPGPTPKPALARASESGDPAVHRLLAELQTARQNGDEAGVEAVTERLADLGYE